MEKVQNPHKRITLDVKSGVLRWFEAREKLRQIAKALEMASEVFRMGGGGAGGGGQEEASRLPGSWFRTPIAILLLSDLL